MEQERLTGELNAETAVRRLQALRELKALYDSGELAPPKAAGDVNNHIHTTYSFSPYSPAKAAYMAWQNGLTTAGIMDHDSVGGAVEFIEAGHILGISTTVGFECRCRMDSTPFAGRRINNPDQNSISYVAAHGIPHQNIRAAQEWLSPYREKRNQRNRGMAQNINRLLAGTGLCLDFDRDVAAISMDCDGGSVTERHILFALSLQMMDKIGAGPPLLDFLAEKLGIKAAGKNRDMLLHSENPMYAYYLLGCLKSGMVEKFYVDAKEECPDIYEFIRFTSEIGAISAYAYLGDVGDSVTGDKKTQTFEDSYLDELAAWLAEAGFNALTYMPTRNTQRQLDRVIGLCEKHGLFQISGEDINSPFQSFHCEALKSPEFHHLIDSTWALIGHELAATDDIAKGMFRADTIAAMPGMAERIAWFSLIARGTDKAERRDFP